MASSSHCLNLLNRFYRFRVAVQLHLGIPESRGWGRWAGLIAGGTAWRGVHRLCSVQPGSPLELPVASVLIHLDGTHCSVPGPP